MSQSTISLFAFERTAAGRALRTDGLLAGEQFAETRLAPAAPGRRRLSALRLTRRRIRLAAQAAFVDYALHRPALGLSLDDRGVVQVWALAFEEGCLACSERSHDGRRAG